MTCGSNIPEDGILRFTINVADLFRRHMRRRTKKKCVARFLRRVRTNEKRRQGFHERWSYLAELAPSKDSGEGT